MSYSQDLYLSSVVIQVTTHARIAGIRVRLILKSIAEATLKAYAIAAQMKPPSF